MSVIPTHPPKNIGNPRNADGTGNVLKMFTVAQMVVDRKNHVWTVRSAPDAGAQL